MKRVLSVLLGSLLLSGCADNQSPVGAAPANISAGTSTIAWGQSVNGLQAGLSLKSTDRERKVNSIVVFHLQNVGTKPVRMLKLSSQAMFWGEYLPIEVRANGALLKYKGNLLDPGPPPNRSEFIYLQPSQSDSVEAQFLPANWGLMPPFDAELIFVFKNDLREDTTVRPYNHETKKWTTVSGLWTGEARSKTVHVRMGS